jgi:hypothetical protein
VRSVADKIEQLKPESVERAARQVVFDDDGPSARDAQRLTRKSEVTASPIKPLPAPVSRILQGPTGSRAAWSSINPIWYRGLQ